LINEIHPVDLENYVEVGLIRTQTHPNHSNLLILNYTQEVQYKRKWTELTLSARGLVLDTDTNKVVARPFKKFFNLSEDECITIDPLEPYTLWEKMDGSLIILFKYNNDWIWATRGSFTSDQAMWAKAHFEERYNYDDLDSEFTHLFESIFTDNRIVVDYGGDEQLVSLGAIHTETGVEIGPNSTFPTPRKYDLTMDEMLAYSEPNFEGFVVKTSNGRAKYKLAEYVYLHRVVFGLSTVSIWEVLKDGKYVDYVATIPEEFLPWVESISTKLRCEFHTHMASAFVDYLSKTVKDDRKETALNYQRYGSEPVSARFAILDGKDPSEIIWKHIKPEHETIK
jgi:RNA ligase